MPPTSEHPHWWAKGLLFENCNCQIVCPGHVHFEQSCTHDRCLGYWAIHIASGEYDDLSLGGTRVVVAFNSPKRMIDGGWTQRIIIDDSASSPQRAALRSVLTGQAGGPWAVLGRFVGHHVEPIYAKIDFDIESQQKQMRIPGIAESSLEPIRGRDKTRVVTFENIFNQIHAATQVISRGDTTYDDGVIKFENKASHGLYSEFSWSP